MKKFLIGCAAIAVLMFAATAGAVAEKVLKIGVGDVVFINGTKISCSVANPYKQMVCFKHNKRGNAVANTYGATVANGFAGLVRFDSKGKPKVVVKKQNP
jgi:opacity protein-like surface antigen